MEAITKKLYEAMFLVDCAEAADWDRVNAAIEKLLNRADAEIISIRKWDERRLAYEVKGKTRGTYILCYFRAEGTRIRDIERDAQLSEQIMRVLILSAEHLTAEEMEKDTPAMLAEKRKSRAAEAVVENAGEEQPQPEKAEVSNAEAPAEGQKVFGVAEQMDKYRQENRKMPDRQVGS